MEFYGNESTTVSETYFPTLGSTSFIESAGENVELVSDWTVSLFRKVLNAGILPALAVFGVTGNIINMAVFALHGLRNHVNICLFSLSISDIGFLLSHSAVRFTAVFNSELAEYLTALSSVFTGVYLGFLNTSSCLTMILSIERCICVVTPLKAKLFFSFRTISIMILTAFAVFLPSLTVAFYIKYGVERHTDPDTNVTRWHEVVTDQYLNNRQVFNIVVEVVLNTIIPAVSLVVVIAANVIIAVRMSSVLAWRRNTTHTSSMASGVAASSTNRREAALTRMLFKVCVVYIVCLSPSSVLALAYYLFPQLQSGLRYTNLLYISFYISRMLVSVNCSINFLIYYTMSTRFRDTLREVVCRRCD